MTKPRSRRAVLSSLAAVLAAGCVDGGGDGSGDGGDGNGTDEDEPEQDDGDDQNSDGGTPGDGGDSTDDDAGSDDGTDEDAGDGDESTDDGGDGEEEDPEEMVARLPDRSPLSESLVNLVLAEDRSDYADDHDFRYEDGAVQVNISLEPDGEPPDEYLPEDRSGYGDTVIAYVDVDDLVDLALDENVRLVSPHYSPETHEP